MVGYEIMKERKFRLTRKEKGQPRGFVVQDDEILDKDIWDFGLIYDLFENKASFEAGLEKISSSLWYNYLRISGQKHIAKASPGNYFSRSLGVLATQYGFKFQDGLKLDTDFSSAPIGIMLVGNDMLIGSLIRKKLFWKDAISADHGEHTHSLQWLVAARELQTLVHRSIPDLYEKTVDYWSMPKGEPELSLWQFLVDSFPKVDNRARGSDQDSTTDSYRSPQNVTRFLLNKQNGYKPIQGHFVSNYLYRRYANRSWFEKDGNVESGFMGIKVDTDQKEKDGWIFSNSARLVRKEIMVGVNKKIERQEMETFHNVSGKLIMK